MSEKRLSEIMAASSQAVEEAQEVLDEAISDAINTYFDAGVAVERERIIKLLIARGVIRIDALGGTVFVNCDTLEVEYLGDALIKGGNK